MHHITGCPTGCNWLYPIQPYNAGYDPKLHSIRVDAFRSQYRAFDQVLGKILQYVDKNTIGHYYFGV